MNSVAPVPEPDATLVSVVMPVYNAQATMVRSIDSVLAQTHRQLELILVDDGSRDGSAAIMDAYAARDTRVVAVRQKVRWLSTRNMMRLRRAPWSFLWPIDARAAQAADAVADIPPADAATEAPVDASEAADGPGSRLAQVERRPSD